MTAIAGGMIDGLDFNGKILSIQEGESCDLTGAFKNAETAIAKAALLTVAATLYDESTGTVINTRNAQDILDANGGSVDDSGNLTLRLDPADNVLVGSPAVGSYERHVLRIAWTWNDGVATRTGIQQIRLYVESIQEV